MLKNKFNKINLPKEVEDLYTGNTKYQKKWKT